MSQLKNPSELKRRAIQSAGWVTLGYGLSQVLRFVSNLVLTHFLAPEFFGVMAIVNVLMIGLAMFSDIGIEQSIIQHRDVGDRDFFNTAWTLQVVRGIFLWFCCVLLAWPMSIYYDQSILLWLIPVAGLVAIISGFNSTAVFSVNRNLVLGKLTAIDLLSQISAIVLMVCFAFISPSVWVLVGGALSAALVKLVLTHVWLADEPNKLLWDSRSIQSLVKFGRWILIGTLLSFFVNSSGSLILGKFVSMAELGLFSIGATLSKMVDLIYQQIASKVIFPIYVHIKDMSNEEIRRKVFKIRAGIIAVFLPPLWGMTIFGQQIVDVLFDPRYHDAGWVLQVFSLGSIPMIISGIGPFYLALGDSLIMLKLSIYKFVCFASAVVIGWWVAGPTGMICGMALFTLPVYLSDIYVQKMHSIWIAKLDLLGYGATILVISIGFYLSATPHWVFR